MRYSQLRAMWGITKASLRAIMRSPSSVVFGFAFPFIFILVFGFIGNSGGMRTYRVVIDPASDTSNALYQAIRQGDVIKIASYDSPKEMQLDMQKGRIAGMLSITKDSGVSPYQVRMTSTTASNDKWPQLKALLDTYISQVSDSVYKGRPAIASFNFNYKRDITTIREYKTIDFILPGQLGFSLLSSGVFGVAFMFFNLRSLQVLKRFFATPISKTFIILGESLSRVIFNMITAVVIIGAGYFFFEFTLVNGLRTFFEMLALSFLGLVLFMGFGFIVSGLAKTDSTIPPLANMITLPQFLLGGTFFTIDAFPKWLQPISRAMPLTHLNNAMRSVAFEGHNLWEIRSEIGILLLWTMVVYLVATKLFRWE